MASRCYRLNVLLALVATACDCGEGTPPDDTFDGNVIIGDGMIPDADLDAESDAGDLDASDDDARTDASDASDSTPDSGDPCSEPEVTTLTASAAIAEIDTWAGMIVEITGTATQTGLSCTEIACPEKMPCCNTCTATVTIENLVPLLGGSCFASPGCTGSECAQVCRPALIGIPQRFRGTLLDRGTDGVGLELFSVTN